jgi:solute carrier family 25 (mitochondrial S-adenosylmethionine transporter), member 26
MGYFTTSCTAFVQVRTLLRRDGLIKGLYAGYGAFLLRDLPFDAIEFWAFDTLNIRLKAFLNRDLNAVEQGVCGAAAGAVTGASEYSHFLPRSREID